MFVGFLGFLGFRVHRVWLFGGFGFTGLGFLGLEGCRAHGDEFLVAAHISWLLLRGSGNFSCKQSKSQVLRLRMTSTGHFFVISWVLISDLRACKEHNLDDDYRMLWDRKLSNVLDEKFHIKSPHLLFHLSLPKLQWVCDLLRKREVSLRAMDEANLKSTHAKHAERWETEKNGGLHCKHLRASWLLNMGGFRKSAYPNGVLILIWILLLGGLF